MITYPDTGLLPWHFMTLTDRSWSSNVNFKLLSTIILRYFNRNAATIFYFLRYSDLRGDWITADLRQRRAVRKKLMGWIVSKLINFFEHLHFLFFYAWLFNNGIILPTMSYSVRFSKYCEFSCRSWVRATYMIHIENNKKK